MLSIPDMAILGAAALIFFGPEQLPKVARKAGLFMRDVQNTSQSFIREMERAADEHESGADVSRAHLLEDPIPHASNGTYGGAASGYEPPVNDGQHARPPGDDLGVPTIVDEHVVSSWTGAHAAEADGEKSPPVPAAAAIPAGPSTAHEPLP